MFCLESLINEWHFLVKKFLFSLPILSMRPEPNYRMRKKPKSEIPKSQLSEAQNFVENFVSDFIIRFVSLCYYYKYLSLLQV